MEKENPQQKSKAKKPQRNRKWWAKQIAQCNASGMTMVAYAEKHHLSLSNLYRWKTVLKRREKSVAKQKANRRRNTEQLKFVEVSLEEQKSGDVVEIVAPNGWSIRVPAGMHAETASRFLNVIESRS